MKKKKRKEKIVWLMVAVIAFTGFGCSRPVSKIVPVEKISKKKGRV